MLYVKLLVSSIMRIFKNFVISSIVTCFFVGRIKIAPGTFGSGCAFPIYFGLSYCLGGDNCLIAIAILLLFLIGVKFSTYYIENRENKDPKEVVIDEVVGQMMVIYFCNNLLTYKSDDFLNIYILPFFFFRFFDIYKPWPISLVDKKMKSGFGIMFDDILAAIFAMISMFLMQY